MFALLALFCSLLLGEVPAHAFDLRLPFICPVRGVCEVAFYYDHEGYDYRCGHRSKKGHEGTDFGFFTEQEARAGISVVASAAGKVVRVRTDGDCGYGIRIDHAENWSTQYCHLRPGSILVKEGDRVSAGERLGLIGMSGSSEFYHVHLSVRHNDRDVDPFAVGYMARGCGERALRAGSGAGSRSLVGTPNGHSIFKPGSDSRASAALEYQPRLFLAGGFTDSVDGYDYKSLVENSLRPPAEETPLVAYMYFLGAEKGDRIRTLMRTPRRQVAKLEGLPFKTDLGAAAHFLSDKYSLDRTVSGVYAAEFEVIDRDGKSVLSRQVSIPLRGTPRFKPAK